MELTFITAFEVPPSEDEAFLATRATSGTMHRALREDADFRFVDVARAGAPEVPNGASGFPSHPGVYEVIRSEGRPDVDGGVLRIDFVEVPDAGERYLEALGARAGRARAAAGLDRAAAVPARRAGRVRVRRRDALVEPADGRARGGAA